jgi:hypothetical protein
MEKLRPGEAVESLLRPAVDAGGVTRVSTSAKLGNSVRMFDDALFRSRLVRLKTSLEIEERIWKETGREMEDKESDSFIDELRKLGRRPVSEQLVKEFEATLAIADKQYEEAQHVEVEREING